MEEKENYLSQKESPLKKPKKKVSKKRMTFNIIGLSSLTIISTFLITFLVLPYFQNFIYEDFYKYSEELFRLPGLDLNYVHQGLTYVKDDDIYLTVGYMENPHEGSRIGVYYSKNKSSKLLRIETKSGKKLTDRIYDVTINGNLVYIASGNNIYTLKYDEILKAPDQGVVTYDPNKDVFKTPLKASYISSTSSYIYLGEDDGGDFILDPSHKVEDNNDTTYALTFIYEKNNESNFLIDPLPKYALAMPSNVKGFDVYSDLSVAVLTSYSLLDSTLYIYDKPSKIKNLEYVDLDNETRYIPLYMLKEGQIREKIILPPMGRSIECQDKSIYIGFESACKKNKFINMFESPNVIKYHNEKIS